MKAICTVGIERNKQDQYLINKNKTMNSDEEAHEPTQEEMVKSPEE